MAGIERPFRRGDPLSPELLARIQRGIIDSPDTPRAIKNAIRASGGQDVP